MSPALTERTEPPDRHRPGAVDGEDLVGGSGAVATDRRSKQDALVEGGSLAQGEGQMAEPGAQASGAVAPWTQDARVEDGAFISGTGSSGGTQPPIAKSACATSASLPLDTTRVHADRLAHHLPASSHASTSTPPMRRVPRLSPNSRNERPAPSTLSSDYFSLASSSSRSHRRQGSLPPSNRRARATSLSPATTPHAEQPTQPRPSRHLDVQAHWLSEDEASEVTFDFDRARRSRRRRPGSNEGPDRGADPDRKLPMPSGLAVDGPMLPGVQHVPPKEMQVERSPTPMLEQVGPSIAIVLPKLASLLTCPSCRRLFHNPTTIACGHSHCLVCPGPPRDPYATPPIETASTSASEFTFAQPEQTVAHASTGAANWSALSATTNTTPLSNNQLYRTLSSASTASTPSVSSRRSSIAEPPAMVCPVESCAFPHSQLVTAHPPLKVDQTLRKLVEVLERAVGPALDDLVKAQQATARAGEDGVLAPMFSDVQLGSEAPNPHPAQVHRHGSGSSGGGEDEPMADDESKRAHKSGADWRSSKKRREVGDRSASGDLPVSTASDAHSTSTSAPTLPFVPPTLFAQLQNECECQICFQLFHEPVTAPCGHSYCRSCLARSYDHSNKCPLCRADLPPLAYFRWQRTSHALAAVIEVALPELAAERAAAVKEEERALLEHVPIFVCTTAWPGIKSYLHIFEPRYRLMIRRALESPDKSFGMVLPLPSGAPDAVNEFGTMLRITSCQMLEDGRLILETIGTHRFRLVERGVVDGYNIGKIERVDDVSPEQEAALERAAIERSAAQGDDEEWQDPDPEPGSRPPMTGNAELTTQQLMQICLDFLRTLRAGSAPWVIERLNRTVGEVPTNAHDFSWFAAEVFPVEDHVKVALLQITSVRERLRLIVFWIEQIRSSWWYSRGCIIA